MKRIHFVGIGGIGMSGLAQVIHARGFHVRGSDAAESENTRWLRSIGIPVVIGHAAEHVGDADLVVYSSAVNPDVNPETLEARRRGIPLVRRAELLAHVTRLGKSLAIAGTHGKTTTTSLCGRVLIEAGFDPTVIVGGRLRDFGGSNARVGAGEWFVVEADEYDRSFLQLAPTLAIITNVEAEHLDVYGSVDAVERAFVEFAHRVSLLGALIVCGDDPGCMRVVAQVPHRVVTYGFGSQCMLRATDVEYTNDGVRATVLWLGKELGQLVLRIPGAHNICNALAAIAVGLELDVPYLAVQRALSSFEGVIRRFQVMGNWRGVTIIDDYAHHPTEVRATLRTVRERFPGRRIVAVFQPHTYTRTRDFASDFARALTAADLAIVTDIYAAREAPISGVSGHTIVASLNGRASQMHYAPTHADVRDLLARVLAPGDVLITMGAGDIVRIAEELVAAESATFTEST
jgi:UDP-N-acetylmuramate--alanine ligase